MEIKGCKKIKIRGLCCKNKRKTKRQQTPPPNSLDLSLVHRSLLSFPHRGTEQTPPPPFSRKQH